MILLISRDVGLVRTVAAATTQRVLVAATLDAALAALADVEPLATLLDVRAGGNAERAALWVPYLVARGGRVAPITYSPSRAEVIELLQLGAVAYVDADREPMHIASQVRLVIVSAIRARALAHAPAVRGRPASLAARLRRLM